MQDPPLPPPRRQGPRPLPSPPLSCPYQPEGGVCQPAAQGRQERPWASEQFWLLNLAKPKPTVDKFITLTRLRDRSFTASLQLFPVCGREGGVCPLTESQFLLLWSGFLAFQEAMFIVCVPLAPGAILPPLPSRVHLKSHL